MGFCYGCNEPFATEAEGALHTYIHLQEFWPDRDYSQKIASMKEAVERERAGQ